MARQGFWRSHLPPEMPIGKPEIVAEPPAQPHTMLCASPPKPEHHYQCTAGHAYEAGYGVAQCLKLLASQYVYYNSGSDKGSSESFHGCKNKLSVELLLSEEVLWPSASLSQSATRLRLGEPPIVSPPQSYYPQG